MAEIIKNAKTVLWNGPVGVFEFPSTVKGLKLFLTPLQTTMHSLSRWRKYLSNIDLFGIADKISYISTGGGAFLRICRRQSITCSRNS